MSDITALIIVASVMFCVLGGVTLLAHIYSLNHIKSKTVGAVSTEPQDGHPKQKSARPTSTSPSNRSCGGGEKICPQIRASWWAAPMPKPEQPLWLILAMFTR